MRYNGCVDTCLYTLYIHYTCSNFTHIQHMIIFVSPHSAVQLFILMPNFNQILRTGEVLKVTKFLKTLQRNFISVLPAGKAARWTFVLLAFRESTHHEQIITNYVYVYCGAQNIICQAINVQSNTVRWKSIEKVASSVLAISISFFFSDTNKIN